MLSVVIEDEVLQHHADAAATRGTMTATLRCCNETLLQRHTAVLVPHRCGAATRRCCNAPLLQSIWVKD